jgi:GTP diphosphokinase / guanosine-3',5'-bis(diphosphate) 3'-diphosphatase
MLHASAVLKGGDLKIPPEFEARLEHLLELCRKSLPSLDEEMIRRAFRISYWAHRNDQRASGEPYINHPIEVAEIVAEEIAFDDLTVAQPFCTTWSRIPSSRSSSSARSSGRRWRR